ncbi:MAG: hypothetical protein VX870_12960, partial [Pseudomonadota bacterium]|nr:hypothetical protein [Pseudomonadota bacterium]
MPENRISGELLNQNLDKLQHFVQRRVLVSNEEATCELELNNSSPWSTITFAREQYIVLSMTSDCQPDSFKKLVIDGVWQELPDHKIIVEGDVLGNVPRHVLDQNTPKFTRLGGPLAHYQIHMSRMMRDLPHRPIYPTRRSVRLWRTIRSY